MPITIKGQVIDTVTHSTINNTQFALIWSGSRWQGIAYANYGQGGYEFKTNNTGNFELVFEGRVDDAIKIYFYDSLIGIPQQSSMPNPSPYNKKDVIYNFKLGKNKAYYITLKTQKP